MLTVGITVVMTTAFVGFLILLNPGPTDELHAELAIAVDEGPDDIWGSGDETLEVLHRGGEALPAGAVTFHVAVGDQVSRLTGATLGSAFSDERLVVGETWALTTTIPSNTVVSVDIVSHQGGGSLVASTITRTPVVDCTGDATPPTVSLWVQTPGDVTTSSTGDITVTATLLDGCVGVDQTIDPGLEYRTNDGSDPSFLSVGAMTRTTSRTWTATIPEPGTGWVGHVLEDLEYRLTGMTDLNGNTGTSTTRSDTVQIAGTYTYVATATATTGTVTDLANARSASDAGAAATLTEGASSGAVSATFDANAVADLGSFLGGTQTFASDDVYATTTASNPTALQLGFTDETLLTAEILGVVLNAETSIDGYVDDQWTLQACVLLACTGPSTYAGSATDQTLTLNVSGIQGAGGWTWVDLNLLTASINGAKVSGPDGTWRIDHVYLEVTYRGTSHDLDVQMDFPALPGPSSIHAIEVKHSVSGDTFQLQAWDGTSWNLKDLLVAPGLSVSTTLLTDDEVAQGPLVRFIDNDSATGQGAISLDYVRVVSS